MKDLKDIITEKLRLDKNVKRTHTCQPKNKYELRSIIKKRLEQDKDVDLNDIDVSKITAMNSLFEGLNIRDIKIDKWDVSNIRDMSYMFYRCDNFNCDLSNWDVSNVKYMYGMFKECKHFEGIGLENWNVSNVKDMNFMFYRCDSLKKKPDWYKE